MVSLIVQIEKEMRIWKVIPIWLFLVILHLQVSIGITQIHEKSMKAKHTNHLSKESSPYLLQHAHNPVDWYPWGEEALAKAKRENKVILVSIGYAACHWCHVMERESFENEEVAKIMNEFFVCIKVDREERPDIDQIYMDAVQLMTGSGGWPLNCFALPDGKPFFGGTYFRPGDWVNVLRGIQNAYLNEREKVEDVAGQIAQGIGSNELQLKGTSMSRFCLSHLESGFLKWKSDFDLKHGGNNRAPKFPLPNSLQFLLRYYFFTKNQDALDHVTLTLDKMARGGIFDQVGGGFARYSVDEFWKVPHFEKMLYDNAQLVSLYAEAYQLTHNSEYRQVAEETLAFVDRELSLPEGGFYASLDADSEGVEGKFYVWDKAEVKQVLGADAPLFCEYYGITDPANWEEGNILTVKADPKILSEKYRLSEKEFMEKIQRGKQLLLKKRESRIRPGLDDKVLTSWNALMLKAYVDAYKSFGEEKYLRRAIKNAEFIQKNLWKEKGHLHRNFKSGISKINGFLDDYSFTIEAFVALYQATFDEQWLFKANGLMEQVIQHFSDAESGLFFYTSNEDPELIARKMEIIDNVIPSSNSSIAKSLFLLGVYLGKGNYIHRSRQMLSAIEPRIDKVLSYHSNWAQLLFWLSESPVEIVVVGKDADKQKQKIEACFLPNVLISGSCGESNLPLLQNRYVNGQTTFYLCKDQTCKLPVTNAEDLLRQLEESFKTKRKRIKAKE